MKTSLLFLLLLPSQLVWAVGQAAPAARPLAQSPLSAMNLLQTALALMLVVVCIVLVGWLLKRSNQFNSAANGQLTILASIPLGTRERAVLVQLGDEQLLLGVTPQQINTLCKLDTPIKMDAAGKISSDFAGKLRQIMKQREKA